MNDEKDGLYDKYRVIKTEDLDLLSKIAEDELETQEVRDYAVQTIKWIEMFAIDGMRDQGAHGTQFVFPLRPDKDFHARVALFAYAASVEPHNEPLAHDLFEALGLMDPPSNMEPD